MKDNKLIELSMDFSVDIINLVKHLKSNHETIIANQIGRSGTSIGANIHEAQYAQGTKDFISKFEIALKEVHIESSTSLFSFIVAPPFPILYHKFICLSNDASPAAI